MTPDQVKRVQQSFEKVAPLGEKVPEIFYAHLFAIDPSLKPLFKGDMQAQGRKLLASLALVVRGLHAPETIVPAVEALGKRHVGYGVKAEDYDTVGKALLRTLADGLGKDFDAETSAAWTLAYNLLADVMKKAAYA